MITKEQLKQKTLHLIEEGVINGMIKNLDKLVESDIADLDKFDNDFILPRIFLNALLQEEQFQYKLHEPTRQEKKLVEQLYSSL